MDKLSVRVDLPESFCAATGVREDELASLIQEVLAVELYRTGRLSLGKAAEVMGMTRFAMIQILAKYDVWLTYDVDDAVTDWETLKKVLSK